MQPRKVMTCRHCGEEIRPYVNGEDEARGGYYHVRHGGDYCEAKLAAPMDGENNDAEFWSRVRCSHSPVAMQDGAWACRWCSKDMTAEMRSARNA